MKRRSTAIMLLVLTFLLSAPVRASADAYAACDQGVGVCRPDVNPDHWCFAASTAGMPLLKESMQWAIDNASRTTDINTSPMSRCTAAADARWREGGGLPDYVAGLYQCTDWAGPAHPQVCYASDIFINRAAHTYAADDPDDVIPYSDGKVEVGEIELNLDISTCHELGHHLGFAHHNVSWYATFDDDCMRNQWLEAEYAHSGWRKYNQHHRDHINAYY